MLKKTYPHEFEQLWKTYPNRTNKEGSFKAWRRHISPEDREELLEHIVERARFDAKWSQGYIPMLQTFINQHRWEDEWIRTKNGAPQRGNTNSEAALKLMGYDSLEDYQKAVH